MLPPAAAASAPRLLGRFVGSIPVTLFRIQGGASVRLRLLSAARAAGRASFDIADDAGGCVQPRAASEACFLGPNGMSMRPLGGMLAVIVANFRGARARIFEVPAGTPLPPQLALLHEHSDHYAVQPAAPMTAVALNAALTAWLAQPAVLCLSDKAAFYARHPEMRPEAVGFSENA